MASDPDNRRTIQIGDLLLDPGRREVRRASDKLKLPKLSYRLLVCLAEAAPAVVSHDELVERVWGGRVISPETVTQRVKLLRRALGDDAANPRYVALVRGEGYRLIPEPSVLAPPDADLEHAPARMNRWRLALAVSLLVIAVGAGWIYITSPRMLSGDRDVLFDGRAPEPNSIAVLPFVNASKNPQDDYISEGLGDALRDQLRRIGGLRVAARASSVIFRDASMDAVGIASRLGVARLIEGTLRHQGDAINVTVYIIDGETGFHTWSQNYERTLMDTNLLAIQQDIAKHVVAQLLPDDDNALAGTAPPSLDPSANELMLLAHYHYQKVREQPIVDVNSLLHSIDLYRRATMADPKSALAHSRLAAALLYLGDMDAAETSINTALSIDPNISEVQYTLGLFKWMRYDDGSGEAQRRAIELNPNNPDALEAYAKWVWHQLIFDEPEQFFLRALEIDPMSIARYADLGTYYGMSGMRDKALQVAEQIPLRFSNANAYMVVARTLELVGDLDEAIAWALRAHALNPDRRETAWMVAELYARISDFETARQYEPGAAFNLLYWERRYEEMIELGQNLVLEQPGQPQLWYGLARAHAAIGEYDQAVRTLESQRIPERAFSENRRANDEEALVTLADALNQAGESERAIELVSWFKPFLEKSLATGGENSWWPHLYLACVHSILHDNAAALGALERMQRGWGMPWYPLLVDAPCFVKFANEPRYRAVVDAIETRQRDLRRKLAATLARMQAEPQ